LKEHSPQKPGSSCLRTFDCTSVQKAYFFLDNTLRTALCTALFMQAVKDFKGGKVEYRLDKSGSLHVLAGRADFPDEKLVDNIKAIQVRKKAQC